MQGRFEKRGDVGIIWINNPPVNAISVGVREAMIDGVKKLNADPEIKVGILACEGRTFMAGADITEFGKPPLSPGLHEAIDAVENRPQLVRIFVREFRSLKIGRRVTERAILKIEQDHRIATA